MSDLEATAREAIEAHAKALEYGRPDATVDARYWAAVSKIFETTPTVARGVLELLEENQRLKAEAEAKDIEFAYASVMNKVNMLYPVIRSIEEALRDLEGDEGRDVGRALSLASNDASRFLLERARIAREALAPREEQ